MTRHFDPVSLRLFVAVCEERNIARAAEREAIVPSAVSKRIAALEADIGAPLLVRGRRGIEPTAAGETLLRQARDLLGAMERMHAELSEFSSGVQGSVHVLASVSVLAERLPDDIGAFLKRYQAVRVSLDEAISSSIVRRVREGGADLGVLWDFSDMSGLHTVPYRSDHLCVVVPHDHPLATRRSVRFAQTLQYESIGVARGGTMEQMLRRQAALLGRDIVHRIQVSSLDAACRIVGAGLGLAVMPREAIGQDVNGAQLKLLRLDEPWAERRFVLCSREESALAPTAKLLMEHLRQHGAPARR